MVKKTAKDAETATVTSPFFIKPKTTAIIKPTDALITLDVLEKIAGTVIAVRQV